MIKFYSKNQAGLTLIETMIYVVLFVILSIVVIDVLMAMTRSFRETSIQTKLMQSGAIMEKISREIKQATSIHTVSGTSLKLNTTDGAGAAKTVTFTLSGTNIQFFENDIFTGNLNSPELTVTSLSFTSISTSAGSAVKFSMSARATNDSQNRVHDFFDSIVLRGDY